MSATREEQIVETLTRLTGFIRWMAGGAVAIFMAGAACTLWFQTRIENRLGNSITIQEFLRWEEQQRIDNPQLKIKSMGLFHQSSTSNGPAGPHVPQLAHRVLSRY